MLKALRLLRERPIRSTEDCVKLGFTYASLTGLERRKLATWRSDGMYAITMDGTRYLTMLDLVADMQKEFRKVADDGTVTPRQISEAIKKRIAEYEIEGELPFDVESTYDPTTKRIETKVYSRTSIVVRQVK